MFDDLGPGQGRIAAALVTLLAFLALVLLSHV
jgi:hypothetical protein